MFSFYRCKPLNTLSLVAMGEGIKVHKLRELREERKKKKKEKEMKSRRRRIATVINVYIVPCSVFFVRLSVSFF